MPTYRLVQVVGSEDGPKKYTIDGTRTNKVLIVRHGVHERPFRIEFVSNQPPTDSEVRGWHKSVLDHNLTLPTKADVEAALAQIGWSEWCRCAEKGGGRGRGRGDVRAAVRANSL